MIVKFGKTYLEELYFEGKSRDKRYRFQPSIVRSYQRKVEYLTEANRVEDLYRFHALHYEALIGDKQGLSSIRINDQYRLEFSVETVEENTVLTVCTLEELTNHYR